MSKEKNKKVRKKKQSQKGSKFVIKIIVKKVLEAKSFSIYRYKHINKEVRSEKVLRAVRK